MRQNPYPPGSFLSECWEFTEAARQLGSDIVEHTWFGRLARWLARRLG